MVQILEVLQVILKEWIGFSEATPGENKKKNKIVFVFFASVCLRFKKT